MTKKFFLSLFSIIMLAILPLVFTSCGDDENNDDNAVSNILGTWRKAYEYQGSVTGYLQYTFLPNGNYVEIEVSQSDNWRGGGVYTIKGNTLTLYASEGDGGTYVYTFNISDTTLTLIDSDGYTEVFIRSGSEQTILNKQVESSFTGWTLLGSTDQRLNGMKTDGATFTLTYTENGKLTVTLVDPTWGKATIKNVNVSKNDNSKYSLQQADGEIVITNPANQEQVTYSCRLHSGYISDDLSTAEDVLISFDMIGTPHGTLYLTFTSGEMPVDEQAILNKHVESSFTGWTLLGSTNQRLNGMKTDGATFTITYTENGKLTVTLVDQTWGTAIINNVDAIISKKGDGKYSLQPADGKIVITNPANQEQIEYDCRLHSGYISDDLSTAEDVLISFDMVGTPYGTLYLTFTSGEMPA